MWGAREQSRGKKGLKELSPKRGRKKYPLQLQNNSGVHRLAEKLQKGGTPKGKT